MATIGTMAVSIEARTHKFGQGMSRADRRLLAFRKSVNKTTRDTSRGTGIIAAGFGKAFAGLAAGAVAVKGLGRVEGFNRSLTRSLAIMGDVSEETQKRMRAAAFATARDTQFSSSQAAEAYFFLSSAGLSAEQSIAALPKVAQFAQAGNFDLARATDLLTDAQSALGLTVDDTMQNMMNMVRVSDVLVKGNTLANASVEQFSGSLTNKAGASLKIVGKDLEEGVAVLAAFADQGIKDAEAGTALSIVLRDLSTKAIRNAAAFEASNIAVFDAGGEMRNLGKIVEEVEDALSGMSDEQAKATLLGLGFSDKSVIFIQTLIGMSGRIQAYEKDLRIAGGTTEAVANKSLTPMEKGIARLSAGFDKLLDALSPVVDALGAVLGAVGDLFELFGTTTVAAEGTTGELARMGEAMERIESRAGGAAEGVRGLRMEVSDLDAGLEGFAKQTMDSVMTNTERFEKRMGRLQELFDAGKITGDTLVRARLKAAEGFGQEVDPFAGSKTFTQVRAIDSKEFRGIEGALALDQISRETALLLEEKLDVSRARALERINGRNAANAGRFADEMARAEEVVEGLKTPFDRLNEGLAEAEGLFKGGFLTRPQFEGRVKQLNDGFGETRSGGFSAAGRSTESLRAVAKLVGGSGVVPPGVAAAGPNKKNQEKQLDEQKKSNGFLETISRRVGEGVTAVLG